jgi:la-related protein 6
LIQQQQQLQVQLQQQAQAQLMASRNESKTSNITDLWAQRSQQLFGAGQKFAKNQAGRSSSKKSTKSPKMRPDEGEMVLPDAETQQAIIEAAEMYFSNENLAKDHYLLRQICQKSEGYLSIKLLTALKNVKKLTKDWRVTAFCLKNSNKLQLNEEETKVRRIDALPEYVLKARSITNVLCIKMPNTLGSVGAVTSMFSEYGRISLVRVLLEGKPVPCDLRNYATQVPDMGTTLCAVVEFESEEEATNCVKQLNSRQGENGQYFKI